MRTLIFSMTVSLDGYITDRNGDINWSAPSEELHRFHNEQVAELGLHVMGRRLYEVMTYWEDVEEDDPSEPEVHNEFTRIWRRLPKIVYSKTLETVVGNTTLSRADPVEEVAELKASPGGDIGVGGAELASALTEAGLIDDYRLFVAPVVLGGGRRFFGGETELNLELVETRTFGTGVTYMRYRRV